MKPFLFGSQFEYLVEYEPTKKNWKPVQPRGVMKEGAFRFKRQLCMKEMACNIPCQYVLLVGTRVIAKFDRETSTDTEDDGQFFSGIVAEICKSSTKNR